MSERDLKRLLALWERTLGEGWLDVSEWLRSLPQNSVTAIEQRLLQGDIGGLVQDVESAALKFAAETQAAYTQAGQSGAAFLDARPGLADKLIRFDASGSRAVQHARMNQLELVQGLTQETRETVRTVLVEGTRSGANPRAIARDIRDSITLTPNQARHVANYRRALEQGDFSNALGRELRDARSDRTLRRASRDGGQLTEAQIDAMVERYRKNYVAYRAETIARTESARNVHAGLAETQRQAIERGDLEAGQLVREWLPGPRTADARAQHQAMAGQMRRVDEPFEAPDGTKLMFPGDPSAGPEHTANCRCTLAVTFMEIPKGFTANGAKIEEGLPRRDALDESTVYSLTPEEYRSKLIALPGAGSDERRLQSVRDAWDSGTNLPPLDLFMTESGDLYVNDGRHRLLAAMEDDRPVLARIGRAAPGVEHGTERLGR